MDVESGSSPRVRGTVYADVVFDQVRRFIPAGAGNGTHNDGSNKVVRVHPRGCGERIFKHGYHTGSVGSSPRVRGTDGLMVDGSKRFRFIPAGAGNG